jgi:hypothetical protein
MKKLIFILSAFLILVSITSCRQNDQIADEYRNNLNLKSELEQKETFKNLDTDSKIRIWKSKLEQIKTKDISSEQKNLINNISNEVSKMTNADYDGIKLFEYAIEMAKITPEDEFIRMFSVIGDYNRNNNLYNNSTSKLTEGKLVKDLENYLTNLKTSKIKFLNASKNNSSQRIAAKDCNCRWTCLFYSSVTNDNCNKTNSGCGFLWTQECTAVV